MADKINKAAEETENYAAKHPRRMYGSFLALGTVLGASMMAAKKNRDRNALQKFIDQLGK